MTMRRLVAALAIFAVVIASAACSAHNAGYKNGGGAGGDNNGGNAGAGGNGGVIGGGDDASTDGPANEQGCTDDAKNVFVVTAENDLYSFYPPTLTFTKIGTLNCPAAATPNSMAVDRDGVAWVNFTDGNLYRVSTKDATCESTTYLHDQSGFDRFGMGFSTDPGSATSEKLFICSLSGQGLAQLDLRQMKVFPIGAFAPAPGMGCELTGTGDGRLYGFFTGSPAALATIEKGSAGIGTSSPLQGVDTGTDWAFSFWGGDFYLYTADRYGTQTTSQVQRYRPGDPSIVQVIKDVGFRIVGAGVSTCAPLTPPPPR